MADAEKGFQVEPEDVYISPTYGEPKRLRVQQVRPGLVHNHLVTHHVRNVSPLFARIGTWPKHKHNIWWNVLIVPWVVCIFTSYCILAFSIAKNYFLGSSASDSSGTSTSDYTKFKYEYNGYAETATNAHEEFEQKGKAPFNNNIDKRHDRLRSREPFPRQLIKISEDGYHLEYVKTKDLGRKIEKDNPTGFPQYLFVSYTSDQFGTTNESEILRVCAAQATKRAGLKYFWDTSCLMKYSEHDRDDDTYDICDYVRNAVFVLVQIGSRDDEGELSSDLEQKQVQVNNLLRRWGERAWTFPEALLAKKLMLGIRDEEDFITLYKKDLLKSAWKKDFEIVGRLVDHHEGTTVLSRLEHVTTALAAIQTRTTGPKYRQGDRAYVLMGFLSQRPEVHPLDSDFEAFARLSLANDSDSLMERLICIAPLDPIQPWHDMRDAWSSRLWNIKPTVQVCGIAQGDTVILSGIQAAAIRWKDFKGVPVSLPHIEDCSLLAIYATLALATVVYYPWFVERLLNGSLWGVDDVFDDTAMLMGFEGYMAIEDIERSIWGSYNDRLSWSPFGSPLSVDRALKEQQASGVRAWGRRVKRKARKRPNQAVPFGHRCSGKDPWKENGKLIQARAEGTGQRVFTLVDTYNEEVIMFLAKRPPVAMLACGEEGGMLRGVGVSYMHETETLYRECVIRLQTPALDSMHRLGRVRFGFHRPDRVTECLNDSPI